MIVRDSGRGLIVLMVEDRGRGSIIVMVEDRGRGTISEILYLCELHVHLYPLLYLLTHYI